MATSCSTHKQSFDSPLMYLSENNLNCTLETTLSISPFRNGYFHKENLIEKISEVKLNSPSKKYFEDKLKQSPSLSKKYSIANDNFHSSLLSTYENYLYKFDKKKNCFIKFWIVLNHKCLYYFRDNLKSNFKSFHYLNKEIVIDETIETVHNKYYGFRIFFKSQK